MRCAGVKLKDGTVLHADLVVDASGPRGKTKDWLVEGGYPVQQIRTVEVDPHVGYTTVIIDVPEEARCSCSFVVSTQRSSCTSSRGCLTPAMAVTTEGIVGPPHV